MDEDVPPSPRWRARRGGTGGWRRGMPRRCRCPRPRAGARGSCGAPSERRSPRTGGDPAGTELRLLAATGSPARREQALVDVADVTVREHGEALGRQVVDELGEHLLRGAAVVVGILAVGRRIEQRPLGHLPEPQEAQPVGPAVIEQKERWGDREVLARGVGRELPERGVDLRARLERVEPLELAEDERRVAEEVEAVVEPLVGAVLPGAQAAEREPCSRKCSPSAWVFERGGYPSARMSASNSFPWTSASE